MGKVGDSWFNSRLGDAEGVQDLIFLFQMLFKGMKWWDGFEIFLRGRRDGKKSSISC